MELEYTHALLERVDLLHIKDDVAKKVNWGTLTAELATKYQENKKDIEEYIGAKFGDNGGSWFQKQRFPVSVFPAIVPPVAVLNNHILECYLVPWQQKSEGHQICAYTRTTYPKMGIRLRAELEGDDIAAARTTFLELAMSTDKIRKALYTPFAMAMRNQHEETPFCIKTMFFKLLASNSNVEDDDHPEIISDLVRLTDEKLHCHAGSALNEVKNPSAKVLRYVTGISGAEYVDNNIPEQDIISITSARNANELAHIMEDLQSLMLACF